MARKTVRGRRARAGRQKPVGPRRGTEAAGRPDAAGTDDTAGTSIPGPGLPVLPAVDPRPHPPASSNTPPAARGRDGQRAAAQQVACGWCGQPVTVKARGPVPRWCSARCRRWARERAAQAELAAQGAGGGGDGHAPDAPPAHRRTGRGQRTPGQQIACGWCGQPITIRARGPVPRWCSASCRHRAWEQHRAARSGLAAVHVHDRYIQAIPNNIEAWIGQLSALTDQIRGAGENRPIRYPDLDLLAAALDLARAATDEQKHRTPPYRPD